MSTKHYAYLLKCSDDSLYAGYTTDIDRRENEHNKGVGSKYTRPRQPSTIVHYEVFDTRSEAQSREAAIKKLTRLEKEKLINDGT